MSPISAAAEIAGAETARRVPATVWTVVLLTPVLALVTSGGAVYFSLLWEGAPQRSLWTVAFAVAYVAISVAGVVAALGLIRGNRRAYRTLVGYAAFGICFTLVKLVFWQETEAIVFGAASAVLLASTLSRPTRRHLA
jgi:hypothetical protein